MNDKTETSSAMICTNTSILLAKARMYIEEHEQMKLENEVVNMSKYATRGKDSYSLTYRDGRMSLYCWHGDSEEPSDSESLFFSGTVEDFDSFIQDKPESWFNHAAILFLERRGALK